MKGYAAVTLLLAGGMALTVARLDAIANAKTEFIRAEERESTLVERLRWNGELIVSDGRGYLLSGEPSLLLEVRDAQASFQQGLRALQDAKLSIEGSALVAEVQQAALAFQRVQEQLVAARPRTENPTDLIRRFEAEFEPVRRTLSQALADLASHKNARITRFYEQAKHERAQLMARTYGLLGILVMAAFGIAGYFTRALAKSYRQEEDALEGARKALAARDELMAVVAHDLRNPLGAIMLKAALMHEDGESEHARKQADSIANISKRMDHLITTMLDVVTLEAGRFSVSPAENSVDELMGETLDMFGPLAESKRIRLQLAVRQTGLTIRADRERVLQVLSNLLGNALKFTPAGGEVGISIERQEEVVCFTISDTGGGIPGEHLPHLFERFWKHETRGKKGTGLGLFIAKGIIQAHQGRIWVESDLGRGAAFHFTLPMAEPAHAAVLPSEMDASQAPA